MLDAAAQELRCGRQPADVFGQHVHQFGLRVWSAVGQATLEVVPDPFVGIQFRGVGGERHEVKAARSLQEFLDRVSAVNRAVIQQDDELSSDLAE